MDLRKALARRLSFAKKKSAPNPEKTQLEGDVLGAIDVVHDGSIVGWVSDRAHGAPSAIDCTLDGKHLTTVSTFFHRQDLQDLGYGNGILGFSVPIDAERLDGGTHDIRVHAFSGDRKLGSLRRALELPAAGVLNANPYLHVVRGDCPDHWSWFGEGASASLQLGNHLPAQLRTFTRIVGSVAPTAPIGLEQRFPTSAGGPLACILVARSATLSRIRLEDPGGWREELPLAPSWTTFRVPVTAEALGGLAILAVSPGHAVIDVAFAGLFHGSAERAQVPPPKATARPHSNEQAPPPVETFTPPTTDSTPAELPSGWFITGAGATDHGLAVTILPGAIRLSHPTLEHSVRISVRLPRTSILRRREVTVGWDVDLSSTPASKVYLQVLGCDGSSRAKLFQSAVTTHGPGRHVLHVTLSARDLDAVRANAVSFGALELGLEVREPTTLTVHGATLRQATTTRAVDASDERFESAAVAAQASSLIVTRPHTTPAPKQPRLDVVVPVYNAAEDVDHNLRALIDANDDAYRIVVVDDASSFPAARIVDRYAQDHGAVTLVRNPVNRGYTTSINLGLERTTAPFVVFLNSDTIVPPGWTDRILAVFERHPDVAAVGAISNAASFQSVPYRFSRDGWFVNSIPGGLSVQAFQRRLRATWSPRHPRVPLLNGFCIAYRRQALVDIGAFDEAAFPIGYGEENDVCIRLRDAGHALRVADDLYIFHAKSRSFGSRRRALTKQGTAALREKHPTVDWSAIDHELRHHPDLKALRHHVQGLIDGGIS